MKDKNPKKNLSTYSNHNSFAYILKDILSLNKNLIDRKAYTLTNQREVEVINFVKNLVGLNDEGLGVITSGSSEAIIVSLAFHLDKFRETHKDSKPNFVVSELCHNVFEKFAFLFNVELKSVKVDQNRCVDLHDLKQNIDENTFCMVGILGSTETASIDNVESLGEIAKSTGIPLHIDAAIGGFVLPFIETDLKWRFDDISIDSMNISLHKYGTAVPGIGIALFKNKSVISSNFKYEMEYISGGKTGDLGLLCTRNSYQVNHMYNKITSWRYEGFEKYIKDCIGKKNCLQSFLIENGFEVMPTVLPVLVFTHENQSLMSDFKNALEKKGYTFGFNKIKSLDRNYGRIVLRKNVTKNDINFIKSIINKLLNNENEKNIFTNFRGVIKNKIYFAK